MSANLNVIRDVTWMMIVVALLSQRCSASDPAPGRSPGPPTTTNKCDPFHDAVADVVVDGVYNLTLIHNLFTVDVLLPQLIYQVMVHRSTNSSTSCDFVISAITVDGGGLGVFDKSLSDAPVDCPAHQFRGRLSPGQHFTVLNWTLPTLRDNEQEANLSFILTYREEGENVRTMALTALYSHHCRLTLKTTTKLLTWRDIPSDLGSDCQLLYPGQPSRHGVVVDIQKLNVPCAKGFLRFGSAHAPSRICGKLEELPEADRRVYFPAGRAPPAMHVHGGHHVVFALRYHLVDYCYNVTMTARNGSFELPAAAAHLECAFKIRLPYGQRVALQLGFGADEQDAQTTLLRVDAHALHVAVTSCDDGTHVHLVDGAGEWTHCARASDAPMQMALQSAGNRVLVRVRVREGAVGVAMRLRYQATSIDDIVAGCGFGWVALGQLCIAAVEGNRLPWAQAEMECERKGGHLLSVRSEHAQALLDNLLLNSPGYKDRNAYWIGASDRTNEGDFHWSDGLPFSYTNWFPGWREHADYNRQPNDDGLSDQDCVEVRRAYTLPSAIADFAAGYMWNDRDCNTLNYFICERLMSNEPLQEVWATDCNRTLILSRQQSHAVVASPGFPRQYPDNADCDTEIIAPTGYRLILDFEELVIETEPSCSYDHLEIIETHSTLNVHKNNSREQEHLESGDGIRRLCGDWSGRLKLLRHVSKGSRLKLRFSSDYSHHYGGFKARVSMESATRSTQRAGLHCADDRLQVFNHSCYLFVSYPEVMWSTAQQICKGINAQLASVLSADEERFITTNIRKLSEYRTGGQYWLGAHSDRTGTFAWIDGNRMHYMGWLPGDHHQPEAALCLSIQWAQSPTPMLPSGLYWKSQHCGQIGGYVCKRPSLTIAHPVNFNRTVNGSGGQLFTPNYPSNYNNNLDFNVRIVGAERTRIVIQFQRLDIEPQLDCLYDFIAVGSSSSSSDSVRWCGTHELDMKRFDFVSTSNEALVGFHSDFSITGTGFALTWYTVDTSGCPLQMLTAKEGMLQSPNYSGGFLLDHLNCTFVITAPPGRRVWLHFDDVDLGDNDSTRLLLHLGDFAASFRPFQNSELITDGNFVSRRETLRVQLTTGDHPTGRGFQATYRTLGTVTEETVIQLGNTSAGRLLHLNYPDTPPQHVDLMEHFVAPLGSQIALELFQLRLSDAECGEMGGVDVYDNYAEANGTSWHLCYDSVQSKTPIAIMSFLNTIHVRQRHAQIGVPLNGSLRVQSDASYISKLLTRTTVESCTPNPCLHDGKCVHNGTQKMCQCLTYYTGAFCALTHCDLDPCVFGQCHLTDTSFTCHCHSGYVGATCEQKKRPCEGNPCEGRGVCLERGDTFVCRCHAWWEGARCERRMLHIPYKPLSERMLREPFWLGLMTVFVVMAVIGLVWCAKRHFPEKIEKLLAEEEDRNRGGVSSLRTASVREQLAASGAAAVTVTPSPGPGAPRSLFGRLGIRKPSILSLTSPHASGYSPATARTFSLDDLLKPPMRRTPSPKKKRNNSTPTKKSATEKKQILQQLITPSANQLTDKVSLGELVQMEEAKGGGVIETPFVGGGGGCGAGPSTVQITLADPKLEKKVTFARLLNRVSAEMSSSSEMELGIMQTNRLSCAIARPKSTPPSPCGNTSRSSPPNSTSSNQGSDSFTSTELVLPMSALSCSISDLAAAAAQRKRIRHLAKPSSADSILAMFRNMSPMSTPTASTPQEDIVGDDESSTSSLFTPMSISLEAPEGPSASPTTIELNVVDSLKNSTTGSNFLHPPTILLELPSTISKCLSPIRELPTPLPSPAVTPMMRRTMRAPQVSDEDNDIAEIPFDPQAEDGLILEEAAAMQNSKMFPPPPLIIPTLTIETPSPTHSNIPRLILPGSPPPRSAIDAFPFPSGGTSPKSPASPRLRDIDKPASLDFPFVPPLITITCNLSEPESDTESISPNVKHTTPGMTYLSPFSMVTRGEHTASESNLSSSGYSSMASPGPSRCGSSNPLCLSEMEFVRRPSPLLRSSSNASDSQPEQRGRSDSETLSDDVLVESNDEGIGTDHLDEKADEGRQLKSNSLEVFTEPTMAFLQPPAIVVVAEAGTATTTRCVSPVSSRSESPLSDLSAGVGRFSAQFYGRNKDTLPFTDSDGLYDFPSSDKVNTTGVSASRRHVGRRREKKLTRQKSASPTKPSATCYHLELPYKTPRKSSPKRRLSRNTVVSSSSSSDSITSGREPPSKSSSTPSPDTIRCWATNLNWSGAGAHEEDAVNNSTKPTPTPPTSKLSRLRAISHQIRFLRRLEMSLKRRERTISPSESVDSGDDSPSASSPLLQPEMRKSHSFGPTTATSPSTTTATTPLLVRNKYRRQRFTRSAVLPEDEAAWKRVVITSNGGHSD